MLYLVLLSSESVAAITINKRSARANRVLLSGAKSAIDDCFIVSVQSVIVNGDDSALNLSVVAVDNRSLPSNDAEPPEVVRRRKAELMTSLRLTDHAHSPPNPEVEMLTTDWNGNHLLHDPPPPPSKRRRTDVDDQQQTVSSILLPFVLFVI